MKKFVASVGLVALGASGLHASSATGITAPDGGKPWSLSAVLRGFYDDNINSAPNDANLNGYSRDSLGFEVSPSIFFAFPWEQTSLSLGYTYSYKYYENELMNSTGHDAQTHEFNLALDHAFSERYQLSVKDSFAIGQEPDVLRVGSTMETFQRVPGDNMRNYGLVNFNGQVTRNLGYEIGYANSWFNYADHGYGVYYGEINPSVGGLLNRVENAAHIDSRWTVVPETVLVLGYQFRNINYTGDSPIAGPVYNPTYSSDRNALMNYVYGGLDHTFRPDLTGSLRAGAQFVDYYNDPSSANQVAPYVLASLKWNYMAESHMELGYTHDVNATDQFFPDSSGNVTLSAESDVVYLMLRQRITPKLFATVNGQFQNSSYRGGRMDGQSEQFWMAGLNLEYTFTPNLSAHVGYNYDLLESPSDSTDIYGTNRTFDRNRVYIGLTARY